MVFSIGAFFYDKQIVGVSHVVMHRSYFFSSTMMLRQGVSPALMAA